MHRSNPSHFFFWVGMWHGIDIFVPTLGSCARDRRQRGYEESKTITDCTGHEKLNEASVCVLQRQAN